MNNCQRPGGISKWVCTWKLSCRMSSTELFLHWVAVPLFPFCVYVAADRRQLLRLSRSAAVFQPVSILYIKSRCKLLACKWSDQVNSEYIFPLAVAEVFIFWFMFQCSKTRATDGKQPTCICDPVLSLTKQGPFRAGWGQTSLTADYILCSVWPGQIKLSSSTGLLSQYLFLRMKLDMVSQPKATNL